ncbi:hypothetical protein ES332_D10G075700v1 [Gossypium tomentosum]|uniref:Uncharacterized protein n=1 Tax=Gossypium tomentosum TaxID=34277 RepID=A0A5D2J2Q7_GOSTO|nr:hypothetical protein ES332_D10G075700v1 [Gossypium tomentosum]
MDTTKKHVLLQLIKLEKKRGGPFWKQSASNIRQCCLSHKYSKPYYPFQGGRTNILFLASLWNSQDAVLMDGFRQGTSRKQLEFFPIPSCMLSHLVFGSTYDNYNRIITQKFSHLSRSHIGCN